MKLKTPLAGTYKATVRTQSIDRPGPASAAGTSASVRLGNTRAYEMSSLRFCTPSLVFLRAAAMATRCTSARRRMTKV